MVEKKTEKEAYTMTDKSGKTIFTSHCTKKKNG